VLYSFGIDFKIGAAPPLSNTLPAKDRREILGGSYED
jgi:hypothetical protein